MSTTLITLLVLQGVVFVLWAVTAFRWLFALRAEAVAESGSQWLGPAVTLRTFRGALTKPQYADFRRRLGLLTLLLFGLTVSFAWAAPHG